MQFTRKRIRDTNYPFIYGEKSPNSIDVSYLLPLSHLLDLDSTLHPYCPSSGLHHFSLGLLYQPPNYLSSHLSPVHSPHHCQYTEFMQLPCLISIIIPVHLLFKDLSNFQLNLSLHPFFVLHILHPSHAKLHIMPEYIKSFNYPVPLHILFPLPEMHICSFSTRYFH